MSKKFANSMSIKCKDIEERDKVAKILESVGWESDKDWNCNSDNIIVSTCVSTSDYIFINHIPSTDKIHITDIHEPLIRDLAAACTNDTWQEGERWWNVDEMSPSVVMYIAGERVGFEDTRRPTAKEIIEYHGFELLDDGNVVRKQPKLEDITTEPETCFKTDDGYYIHDGELFYRVLPDYNVEKCVYKNGMRVFDKDHVLARFSRASLAVVWADDNKPKAFFVDDAGNKVYDGETYWFVDSTFDIHGLTYESGDSFYSKVKARFKNKSDAEAWAKKNKPFEPFELSIPIKTKEDLLHLWHRLDIPAVKVEGHDYGYDTGVENPTSNYDIISLWKPVNDKVNELGLKKK